MNNYPILFIHGMYGFGETEKLYDFVPYYGMVTGSLVKRLRKQGIEAYAPKVGPVASAWDRACELWAILNGGTVDYGEAHSKKYGHARFGRTYEKPLIPDWGKKDKDGNLVKIHMFGHSFGGATMRWFVQVLAEGSEEERKASGSNVSPLFEGGKGDWVASITSLAGPHDGTTIMHALPKFVFLLRYGTYALANLVGNPGINKVYDFFLEQWDLTTVPGQPPKQKNSKLELRKIFHAAHSHDNLFWDLRIDGAAEMNAKTKCQSTTYYFTVPTLGTREVNGEIKRAPIMFPALWLLGKPMSKYRPSAKLGKLINFDDTWKHSDGMATYGSCLHPKNEPYMKFVDADKNNLKKGIWYTMPDADSDHGTIIGGSLKYVGFHKKPLFDKFYMEQIDLLHTLD